MIPLMITLEGDRAWPDLARKKDVIVLNSDTGPIRVAVLAGGMQSGKPSVMFRLELPDGTTVLAETSARLFVSAARAITAKYPDLFQGD